MKKSGSIIEAAAGAVIFVIGLVLCFHNYVQKGNTAYAVSLLVAIAGVIVLIAGICNIVSKGECKPVDTKVLAQAALCAALCYVGATFIKIDVPVGTEKTMFHFGNVFCVLAALLIGGAWGGLAGAVGMTISDLADPVVGYFYKSYLLGVPQDLAKALAKIGAITTSVNAVIAVIVATIIYLALRPVMKKTGMLREL